MRHAAAFATLLLCQIAPGHAGDWTVTIPYRDPQSVTAGKVIYSKFCAACHGARLEGQPNWRVRDEDGYLPAPPHDESGHTWHHADTQLYMIVKHGVEDLSADGYKSRMNGFRDLLTDEEILQVMAYIKSTWPEHVIRAHDALNLGEPVPRE